MDPAVSEIERVYLLDRLPDLPESAVRVRIEQGYLPDAQNAPAAGGDEVIEGRLRRRVDPDGSVLCTHTIKRGAGLVRSETQRTITEAQFEAYWPRTAGRRLSKTRHRVPAGPLVWEIDDFDDLDLILAEVELPSPEAEAPPPEGLAPHIVREVTDDRRYRNYELAKKATKRRRDEAT